MKRYNPYLNAIYNSKKDTITITKYSFFGLLKDWDILSKEQKDNYWKILEHFIKKEEEE